MALVVHAIGENAQARLNSEPACWRELIDPNPSSVAERVIRMHVRPNACPGRPRVLLAALPTDPEVQAIGRHDATLSAHRGSWIQRGARTRVVGICAISGCHARLPLRVAAVRGTAAVPSSISAPRTAVRRGIRGGAGAGHSGQCHGARRSTYEVNYITHPHFTFSFSPVKAAALFSAPTCRSIVHGSVNLRLAASREE